VGPARAPAPAAVVEPWVTALPKLGFVWLLVLLGVYTPAPISALLRRWRNRSEASDGRPSPSLRPHRTTLAAVGLDGWADACPALASRRPPAELFGRPADG
jgi:hypothetical protein